ncbi:hypothetical protein [Streptomyces lycii]|uniref:Uncharacterized protein n=1 Tax=Streptomyces lycii TaxID=2654337 RepID=A0ABQ7FN34_9ACTN|nr:hypothetical protein [Streptomyces lycii]KAF4408637.1 hypothetical protein GCU69_13135 [Streptomyces lycii]
MATRKFTRDELEAIGVPFECDSEEEDGYATELHREQISKRRWVSEHELIFRAPDDGKAWRVTYVQGLTEEQEVEPFDYHGEIIEATEMVQREVTVTRWVERITR